GRSIDLAARCDQQAAFAEVRTKRSAASLSKPVAFRPQRPMGRCSRTGAARLGRLTPQQVRIMKKIDFLPNRYRESEAARAALVKRWTIVLGIAIFIVPMATYQNIAR